MTLHSAHCAQCVCTLTSLERASAVCDPPIPNAGDLFNPAGKISPAKTPPETPSNTLCFRCLKLGRRCQARSFWTGRALEASAGPAPWVATRSGERAGPAGRGEPGGHLAASILCRRLPQASPAVLLVVLPGMLSASAHKCSLEAEEYHSPWLLLLITCCGQRAICCPLLVAQPLSPVLAIILGFAGCLCVSQGSRYPSTAFPGSSASFAASRRCIPQYAAVTAGCTSLVPSWVTRGEGSKRVL
jgi:hypothetical protein